MFFCLLTFAISLCHRKCVTADITAVFVNNQHGIQRQWQDFDKNTHKYTQHTRYACRGIKIGALKKQFVCMFPYLLNICRKFEFLISQSSVAACLRWGGQCCLAFVANCASFPAVQKFWISVKIRQSYREFKGGNFFETQCSLTWSMGCTDQTGPNRLCCIPQKSKKLQNR